MSRCKPCWLGRLVCNAAEAFAAPEVQWGQLRAVEAHTSPPTGGTLRGPSSFGGPARDARRVGLSWSWQRLSTAASEAAARLSLSLSAAVARLSFSGSEAGAARRRCTKAPLRELAAEEARAQLAQLLN